MSLPQSWNRFSTRDNRTILYLSKFTTNLEKSISDFHADIWTIKFHPILNRLQITKEGDNFANIFTFTLKLGLFLIIMKWTRLKILSVLFTSYWKYFQSCSLHNHEEKSEKAEPEPEPEPELNKSWARIRTATKQLLRPRLVPGLCSKSKVK